MQNPAEAYGKAAKMATGAPRELEGTLLIKAASQLQRVKEGWPDSRKELHPALIYNRKLWTIFASSAAETDHPLPKEIKQNIANLAVFIFKHTSKVEAEPAPERLDTLININRQIAAGLFQKPGAAQPGSAEPAVSN